MAAGQWAAPMSSLRGIDEFVYLANLVVRSWPADPGDPGKFVMGLPIAHRLTRWGTDATFDPALFPLIDSMNLRSDC
jgi:hypothetical protein